MKATHQQISQMYVNLYEACLSEGRKPNFTKQEFVNRMLAAKGRTWGDMFKEINAWKEN